MREKRNQTKKKTQKAQRNAKAAKEDELNA